MILKNAKKLPLLLAAVFAAGVLGGCGMVREVPQSPEKTVVATVLGQDIKKSEYDKMFEMVKASYEQQYGAEIWENEVSGKKLIDVVKEGTLDRIIDDKIQVAKAAELGINVPDADVEEEVNNWKAYFNSDEKFNEFLSSQKMDINYFKESIKREMIIRKLREKVTENVTVTDEEVANYYAANMPKFYKVKASHILLEKEDEAKKVLDRIKNGEDFGKLAKELSKDTTSAVNNGDLGYFKRGDMVEPFEKAAFELKVGQVSDIVKTDFGYHIIKVTDKKQDTLDEVKEEIKDMLIQEKKNTEYTKQLEDMRAKANIKKYTDRL